jgi:hypothetical protein
MIFSDKFTAEELANSKTEALRLIEENLWRTAWQEGIDPESIDVATFESDGSLGQDDLKMWIDRLVWAQSL